MAIADVIKYEGDNSTFIWKHPTEDFNWGTQLIVHESQEAVLFMSGQALDSFGPGLHLLETQNMPIAGGFFNRATDDRTPFHCEVYFINRTEQMAIKWGTDTKMEYVEPTYGFPLQIGACGEMSVRLEDGRRLLVNVVGTEHSFTQMQLVQKFRAFLLMRLKPYMVNYIKENRISIFEIDEHLQTMSDSVKASLAADFSSYGLSLEQFFITSVLKPEEDRNYRRFKDLHFRNYADVAEAKLRQQVGVIDQQTAAQRMVIEAQGIAQKRSLEGYTYQDERGFDVAERVASNQAVGQMTNLGIGMGMISGIGGTVGSQVGGMMQNVLSPKDAPAEGAATPAHAERKCAKCGAALPENAKFCLECGAKVEPPAPSAVVCPKCGATVAGGKFCLNCGAPLTPTSCPKCGKEIAPGAKFCGECGEKLS